MECARGVVYKIPPSCGASSVTRTAHVWTRADENMQIMSAMAKITFLPNTAAPANVYQFLKTQTEMWYPKNVHWFVPLPLTSKAEPVKSDIKNKYYKLLVKINNARLSIRVRYIQANFYPRNLNNYVQKRIRGSNTCCVASCSLFGIWYWPCYGCLVCFRCHTTTVVELLLTVSVKHNR